jgi:hypothetical protein
MSHYSDRGALHKHSISTLLASRATRINPGASTMRVTRASPRREVTS